MNSKNLHSSSTENDYEMKNVISLAPDAALAVFAENNLEQVKKALIGLGLFFKYHKFDPQDESHTNSLAAVINFIENGNEELHKQCFLTLKSFVRTISDGEIVSKVSSFLLGFIENVEAPVTITALGVLSTWLNLRSVKYSIVNSDVIQLFAHLLEKKDPVLEKAVLKCLYKIYNDEVGISVVYGDFLVFFIKFASQRFDEGTENLELFLMILSLLASNHCTARRLIDENDIYVNLNSFMELEPSDLTKNIITLSLNIWQTLLIKSGQKLLPFLNFPCAIKLITIDNFEISKAAIATASIIISVSHESAPVLFELGLLENVEYLLTSGSSNAKTLAVKLIHAIINNNDPDITKAILESNIFELIVSLLETETNNKFLNIALIIISTLLSQENELGVDIKEMIVENGGEEHLAVLASSDDHLVAEKANIILDQYFSDE